MESKVQELFGINEDYYTGIGLSNFCGLAIEGNISI